MYPLWIPSRCTLWWYGTSFDLQFYYPGRTLNKNTVLFVFLAPMSALSVLLRSYLLNYEGDLWRSIIQLKDADTFPMC